MPTIFINYRRTDSKSEARLLYHELVEKFTADKVIMDIDAIPPAVDFREYLGKAVSACDIFLALVGPHWIKEGNLEDKGDWVRIEIESALKQGKKILPIMVNDGSMPDPNNVPEAIRSFCYINALPLDTGRDFDFHVNRIIGWVDQLETKAKAQKEADEKIRKEAGEQARKEAEAKAREEASEKARKEAEGRARKEASERARNEAEAKADNENKGTGLTDVESNRGAMASFSFWVIAFLATASLGYFNQTEVIDWEWRFFRPLMVVSVGLLFTFWYQSGIERFLSSVGAVSLGLGMLVARVLFEQLDPSGTTAENTTQTLYDINPLKYEIIYNGTLIAIPLVVLVILSIKYGKSYKFLSISLVTFGAMNCLLFTLASDNGYLMWIEGAMRAIVLCALNWHWMKNRSTVNNTLHRNANRVR